MYVSKRNRRSVLPFITGRDALAVMNGASVMMINPDPDSLSVGGVGGGGATGAVISFV